MEKENISRVTGPEQGPWPWSKMYKYVQSDPDFSTVNFSTNPDYSTISWMTNFLLSKKPLILAFSQNCQTPILAQLIFNLFIGNYIT